MNSPQAASRYGNYEVLLRPDGAPERLGGGAFGQTFKARHAFLGQVVALKVINEKFAHDATAKERFLREARVVHGLRHAHIAQITDFGEAHGTLYYAMEYCEGGSLEDLVRRVGPLDPATVELLARQLAEALDCSHRAGFIHRDVKPANVMLADANDARTLKLVDFGLVKPLAQDTERMASLTLDGQNFFTPLFASPEQVMEEELDARSDLFSLGMTLWFLLKGTTPEAGSTAMVMAKRLSAESYQTLLPETLPPRLGAILRRLLEKDKNRRFASAAEVLAALASDATLPEPENAPAPIIPVTVPALAAGGGDPATTMAFESKAGPTRLADKYRLAEKTGRSSLGSLYRANRAGDDLPLFVTVLDDALRENPTRMEKLRAATALAMDCANESLCQVYGLERFEDAEVLVREWNGGVPLQNVVKSRGSIPFAEAVVPLRMVASGVDAAVAAGMDGVRLTPDEIFLQPADGSLAFAEETALLATPLRQWPPFRLRLTPILLGDEPVQDISMTFSEGTGGSPRVEFGSLLYRLVAGMQVKFAARVNRGSYIRTAGLSEDGNRILSGCIVDEAGAPADCLALLAALQRAEGIGDSGNGAATAPHPPRATMRSSAASAPPLPTQATQSNRTEASPVPPPLPVAPPLPIPLPERVGGNANFPAGAAPSSPLVPILIGLGVAAAVLAAAAFVLLRAQPSSGHLDQPARQTNTPAPAPTAPTPGPSQASARTPTPPVEVPTFILRDAARLSPATDFELAGRRVTPTRRADDLVFYLDPAAGASADLVVKVPGYRAVRLSVGAGGNATLPAALDREVLPVYVTLRSREADYAFVAFSFVAPLPGENVRAPADLTYSLRNILSPARIDLPSGKYVYTLYGPGQQQDPQIQPLKAAVVVEAPGRVEVPVPPGFAGRFRGEFDDDKTHAHVVRTITLRPGLTEGRCDEQYFVGGRPNDRSVDGVPLAEIRLDGDGVLHAHIRYVLYRNPAAHTYDEVFELRHNAAGGLVMTGGREMMPTDPVLRSELERKLKDQPPSPANRPGETILHSAD